MTDLTDEEINAIWGELNTPLNESRLSVFGMARIRAIIAADRAKRRPMTGHEMKRAYFDDTTSVAEHEFAAGIRAAELFHGIKT